MSIKKRLLLSSMFNHTWPKYHYENHWKISNNQSHHNQILSDTTHSWIINRFTIIQRTFFIISLIVLFWIIFTIIYMLSRLIIRLISNIKYYHFYYKSPSTSNEKMCRTFVISSNQYGSFRPTYIQSPLIHKSDSLFSNSDFTSHTEQILDKNLSSNTANTSLLEHYLKTYNPLKIDLININEGTVKTSIVKDMSYEEAVSDTDTRPIVNCYALNCTNKRKLHQGGRYVRLKESENCSTTISVIDDRLSECSTKLTSIALPTLMVTDCSDSQRLHTEIIELNEDEKNNE